MTKDKENIHAGHRTRLLETVSKVGLGNLSTIQSIEFILFYIFPRGDTNPLAHRLADKFKNLSGVLDASIEDLTAVKGMGSTAAKKLKGILEIFSLYTSSKVALEDDISTISDVYYYVEGLLRFKSTEEVYIFGFNQRGKFIADRCLSRGAESSVQTVLQDIGNFVDTNRPSSVVLAHNHPGGLCQPSAQDDIAFKNIENRFDFVGCEIIDNLVIGLDGIYSMKKHKRDRLFGYSTKFKDMIDEINPIKDDPRLTERNKF